MEVFVRSILISMALVFFGFNAWSFQLSENDKVTLTFNYIYNAITAGGTTNTTFNLSASPSIIRNDIHEYGGTITYVVNKSGSGSLAVENTTNSLSGFYRYNVPIGDSSAKNPLIGYIGPQVGLVSMKTGGSTTSNTSAGGQVGLNMMISNNIAINFHVLQFDTVFATQTQLLVTQSVGIKYYF